ncbi:STAS domain-containing protein [Actinoplanes sp. KI2]|uniref:STAS domain-containing protein n=1 Tax=Actinoplanes sp. KI2 TaxID=2983315 RepID=UPI0021D584C9|nr:STAS domain-containing protein [Actinoplanes sp. KI2]MCU7728908.1 STAS domain-containing protein [Actinoplanes sp. KI2]
MSKILNDHVPAPSRGADLLGWSQRRVGGAYVIFLAGELDLATAPELRSRLMSVAETSTAAVLMLNLSQVHFIDAKSAGIIACAREAAGSHGTLLQVDGLHGVPKVVFDVLGLTPLLAGDGGRDPLD